MIAATADVLRGDEVDGPFMAVIRPFSPEN
jgi:hypothetical protein